MKNQLLPSGQISESVLNELANRKRRELLFSIGAYGLVFGIAPSSFVNLNLYVGVFLIALGFIIYFYIKALSLKEVGIFIAVFLILAGFGVTRFAYVANQVKDTNLDSIIGKKVELTGVISDEPDLRETNARLTIDVSKLILPDRSEPVSAKVLTVTDLYPEFNYGDEVKIVGTLTLPENFETQGGRIFDYVSYLKKSGIGYEISFAKISKLQSGQGNFIKANLLNLKRAFTRKLNQLINEPESALLGGLLLGTKQSLGKDLLENFRKAGVIHIVVLSGYNITIVAEGIMKFFSFLPRMFGSIFGGVGIILFAILTGGGATVVRASIMALLAMIARMSGRTYGITRALILAGLIMIIQNPHILIFDLSFQLSFLSTFGLIYISPIVESRLGKITEAFGIRSIVSSTIATQIFVLPFLLYAMGQFSTVALFVNLLILVVIPTTMLFGFLAGSVGFISVILATPLAFIAYGLLAYELGIVNWFANLPFSSLEVPIFPFWIVVIIYIAYFFLYNRLKISKQNLPAMAGLYHRGE